MYNFKIGDEVICVNINGGSRNKASLTLGKIYKVINLWSNKGIIIIDDNDDESEYFFHRFKKANKIMNTIKKDLVICIRFKFSINSPGYIEYAVILLQYYLTPTSTGSCTGFSSRALALSVINFFASIADAFIPSFSSV